MHFMKALLLLATLFSSTMPAKAADDIKTNPEQAYFYGFVYGAGSTLCGALTDKQITKEYAQYFLPALVETLTKHPGNKGYTATFNQAYENVKESDACSGVYQ